MIIIGLTGPMAGGKGVVADLLISKGFAHFSFSDRIREELIRRQIPETRESLQDIADEMRQKHGPAVLAKLTWDLAIKQKKNAVLETLRGESEADFLKQQPNFYLIGITAPQKTRFQYLRARNRQGDLATWEKFLERDKLDFKSGQGLVGRDINACLKKADIVFQNTSTINDLQNQVEQWLSNNKIL